MAETTLGYCPAGGQVYLPGRRKGLSIAGCSGSELSMTTTSVKTVLLVCLLVLAGGCASFNRPGDDWFANDKAMHFGAAAMLSGGTTLACEKDNPDDDGNIAIGVGVAMAFGAGKEWYDLSVKRTYWSWKDFIWDAVGAVAGGLVASAAD